jgi:hypothetical protein
MLDVLYIYILGDLLKSRYELLKQFNLKYNTKQILNINYSKTV